MARISAVDEMVYALKESTFNTIAKPAGTDAMTVRESSMSLNRENRSRDDKAASRSVIGAVAGRADGTFSVRKYLLGSGAAGTKPDDHELWENAFGVETVNGGVDVAYTLGNAIFGNTIQVHRHVTNFAQIAKGAFVNEVSLEFSGVEEGQVTFSGICADVIHVGQSLVDGATTTQNTVTVDTGDGKHFEVGGILSIDGNDDLEITGIAGDVITFDGSALSLSDDAAVAPYQPTASLSSTDPVFGTNGSFSIASGGPSGVNFRTKSISVVNNAALRNDEFATSVAAAIGTDGKRDVTCDLSFWMSEEIAKLVNNARELTSLQYQVVSGATAGNILTVTLPEVLITIPEFSFPNAGDVEVSATGTAVDASAAEGEITATWT